MCSGGAAGNETTATETGTDPSPGGATTQTSSSGSSAGTAAGSDTGTETAGTPEVLCPGLNVSLIVDPAAPVFDPASRQALRETMDRLVTDTGAEVRVRANVGTESPYVFGCTLDLAEAGDGEVLVYGHDFQVLAEAPDALDCLLDSVQSYPATEDEGDYMFSGLMIPILEPNNWPAATAVADGSVGLIVLLAEDDDQLGGMYSRPGMTSEAYLRLMAGNDRRRASALTMGQRADELELFALTLGKHSLYANHSDMTLTQALEVWTPQAIQTCRDHDADPLPEDTDGCKHIDVLFVIDGSFSMLEEQNALRGVDGPPVFKEFTDALVATLTNLEDLRVGVVSAQPGDTALHTHTDQPEVAPAVDTDCGLTVGQPWIVGPSATFESDFACIAATRANTEEYTALNAAEALHDPANAGFLRDDSVLVVVMLTDEDTQEWLDGHARVEVRQRLLDAVGDDLSRVFVLAIAGDQGVFEMPKSTCGGDYGTATPGRRLSSIVFSFRDQGAVQDICDGSLAQVFESVLDDVVQTCETFVPPG